MHNTERDSSYPYYTYFRRAVSHYYNYAQNLGAHPVEKAQIEAPKGLGAWTLFQIQRGARGVGQLFYNIGLGLAKAYYYILSGGAYGLAFLALGIDWPMSLLKKKAEPEFQNRASIDPPLTQGSRPISNSLQEPSSKTDSTRSLKQEEKRAIHTSSAPKPISQNQGAAIKKTSKQSTLTPTSTLASDMTPIQGSSASDKPGLNAFNMRDRAHSTQDPSLKRAADPIEPANTERTVKIERSDKRPRPPTSVTPAPKESVEAPLRAVVQRVIENAQFSSRLQSDYIRDASEEVLSYRMPFDRKPTKPEDWNKLLEPFKPLTHCIEVQMGKEGHAFNSHSQEDTQRVSAIIDDLGHEGLLKYDYPDFCSESEKVAYEEALTRVVKKVIDHAQFSSRLATGYILDSSYEILSYRLPFDLKPKNVEEWQNLLKPQEIFAYCIGKHMEKEGFSFRSDSERDTERASAIIGKLADQNILKYDYPDFFLKSEEVARTEAIADAVTTLINNAQFSSTLPFLYLNESDEGPLPTKLSCRLPYTDLPKNSADWKKILTTNLAMLYCLEHQIEKNTIFYFHRNSPQDIITLQEVIDKLDKKGILKYDYPEDYTRESEKPAYQQSFKAALAQIVQIVEFDYPMSWFKSGFSSDSDQPHSAVLHLKDSFPKTFEEWERVLDDISEKEKMIEINKALSFYMKQHGFIRDYPEWTHNDKLMIREVLTSLLSNKNLPVASSYSRLGKK